MEATKNRGMGLSLKVYTWYKDSHSLFDYESNKINNNNFNFPVGARNIALYRKRQSCNVVAVEVGQTSNIDNEEYQLLTQFEIKPTASQHQFRLNFFNEPPQKTKKINSDRLNTDESNSVSLREEETYLIVRKQKDQYGDPKGYRLQPGQTIKLGRVQFFVSQVCINDQVKTVKNSKTSISANKPTMKYIPQEQKEGEAAEPKQCKICLEDTAEEKNNFLFNPCKCSGSCGTVHLECLLQWIRFKVKKEVVGGTLHYNFEKFECEVCKAELPVTIQTEDGNSIQMLPIDKPKGNYLILEGACEKTKSVMMIQNIPQAGIKLGRGHDCEIRITDISVSRNHALIKFKNNDFYIFDNKSKFGTLVKEDNMHVEVGATLQQGIQIGRSVVILEVGPHEMLKEKQRHSEKETSVSEGHHHKGLLSRKNLEKR